MNINRKLIICSAIALPMLLVGPAKSFEFPEELPVPGEVSANVTLASSYIWRGEVQNGNNPAIQGGFDYGVDLLETYVSAYAGIWGSPAANTDGNLELDYYGGISGAIPGLEDYLSYDGGILYYDYPGLTSMAAAQNFVEYYGSVGVALPYDASVSYYYGYSPTGYGGNYDYSYQNVGGEVPIPMTPFTLFGAVGFTDADESGFESFTDYNIGLATSAFGLDFSGYYTTTDGYTATGVDEDTSAGGSHLVFTVGASF